MPDSNPATEESFVITPPHRASLAVEGTRARFPVRRIWCVGRNYADHAREMGHDPDREPPFFFQKPTDAVMPNHSVIAYPTMTKDLQHEIELVVALHKGGTNIPVEKALDHVFGYGVGLDMTRRDLQTQAKNMGRPWEMGKGFDQSAPISAIAPVAMCGHPKKGEIWVKVNGQIKQKGDLSQHIWQTDETIAYLSQYVALEPGDIIMMGTPAGVGPVVAGDKVDGYIDALGGISVSYK